MGILYGADGLRIGYSGIAYIRYHVILKVKRQKINASSRRFDSLNLAGIIGTNGKEMKEVAVYNNVICIK